MTNCVSAKPYIPDISIRITPIVAIHSMSDCLRTPSDSLPRANCIEVPDNKLCFSEALHSGHLDTNYSNRRNSLDVRLPPDTE